VRREVLARLAAAGFRDLRPSDFVMLQYPPIDRVSPSVLAAQRGISKQALNHLLAEMEARRYFERRRDPRDGRAVLIVPTPRGRALIREARRAAEEIEKTIGKRLGARRLAIVRRSLEEICGVFAQ
jgi:DNA-binding MarR family transcriptional regulator